MNRLSGKVKLLLTEAGSILPKDSLVLGAEDVDREIPAWLDVGKLNGVFGDLERGIPGGRVIELYGPESHGKTAVLYYLLGRCQAAGGLAVLADVEGSFHPSWAALLGVDVPNLLKLTLGSRPANPNTKNPKKFLPEGMEDLMQKIDAVVKARDRLMPDDFCLIGWDSVAATCTRAELEGEYGDLAYASQARVLSKELRRLVSTLKASGHSTLVCVNQLRSKIGGYVAYDQTPGGRALKFYATVRVKVFRRPKLDGSSYKTIGARADKNRVAWPSQEAMVWIGRDFGIRLENPKVKV